MTAGGRNPGTAWGILWGTFVITCHLALLPFHASYGSHTQADWNIVKRGWDAHVLGKAPHTFTDAVTAVKTLRVGGHRGSFPLSSPPTDLDNGQTK